MQILKKILFQHTLKNSIKKSIKQFCFALLCMVTPFISSAQNDSLISTTSNPLDFSVPKTYTITQLNVEGSNRDKSVIILRSGLAYGDQIKIPGDQISSAIKKLWEASLFSDVQIYVDGIVDDKISLVIKVVEKPQIKFFAITGVKKTDREELEEALKPLVFKVYSENMSKVIHKILSDYYEEKGRFKPVFTFSQVLDTVNKDYTKLYINIEKGPKVKVKTIDFIGNTSIPDLKLRKSMGELKMRIWWNPFRTTSFLHTLYSEGKLGVLNEYKKYGFRDAQITKDTVEWINNKNLKITINISEGKRYYYRNLDFIGNTKYTNEQLIKHLGITKGDLYDTDKLNKLLTMDPEGTDISSLYLDDGYLFFNVQPIETQVIGDSVDVLIKIYEGSQAVIGKVTIVGNTKTNDHVILREIYTKPGELFKRSDIIRSQR